MQTALNLHRYLGETDPLAGRYLQILTAFNEAIMVDSIYRAPPPTLQSISKTQDVFATFFGGETRRNSRPGPNVQIELSTTTSTSLVNQNSPNIQVDASNAITTGDAPYPQLNDVASGTPTSAQQPQDPFTHLDNTSNIDRISPPDYSLDFDAFLTAVGPTADQGDAAYQQDLYIPLYSTVDFASGTLGFKQ